jgi:hypothetical protein
MSVLQCLLAEFAAGGVSIPHIGNAARAIAMYGVRFGVGSPHATLVKGDDLVDLTSLQSGGTNSDASKSFLPERGSLLSRALRSCVESEITDSSVMPARASSVMVSETVAAIRSSLESFEVSWAEAVAEAQRKQKGPWEAGTAFLSALAEADKITLADVPAGSNLLLNPFDSALYTPKQWSWTAKDVAEGWVPEVRSSIIAERLSLGEDTESVQRKNDIVRALKSLDESIALSDSLSSYRSCVAKATQLLSTGYAPLIFDFPATIRIDNGNFLARVHRAKLIAEVLQESMVSFGDSVAPALVEASSNTPSVTYKPRKYNGTFGPFLVVTKVGEVFDWVHLFSALFPDHRVLPYIGSLPDREALRCFLAPSGLYTERSHCHIVITHYQSYLEDIRYLRPIKWHAVVMDSCLPLMSNSEYCDPVHDASVLLQCRHRIYSSPFMCSPDRQHLPDPLSCLKWLAPALHKVLMDADGVILDNAPLGALEDRLLRLISSLTCVCNEDFDSFCQGANVSLTASPEMQADLSKLCDSLPWAAWFGLQLVRDGKDSSENLVFNSFDAIVPGSRKIYSPPFSKQFSDSKLDAEMKFVTLSLDSISGIDESVAAGPKVAPFCPFIAITSDQKMQRKRSRAVMADGSEAIVSTPADERKVVVLDDGRIIKRRKRRTKLELMQAAANGELKVKKKPGPKPKNEPAGVQPAGGAENSAEEPTIAENENCSSPAKKHEEEGGLVSPSKRARTIGVEAKFEAVETSSVPAAEAHAADTEATRPGRRSGGASRKVVNALSGETLGPDYEAEFLRSVAEHNGRWKVCLEVPGRTKFLGSYPTRDAAEEVFKVARVLRAEALKNAVVDESAHRKGKFKGRTLKELPLTSMSNEDICNSIRNMALPQRSVSGESGAFYGPDPGPVAYAMCYGLDGFAAPLTRLPTKLGKLRPSALDLADSLGIADPKGLGSRGDVDIHLGNDLSIAHNHAVIEYDSWSNSYAIVPMVTAGVYVDGQLRSEVGVASPLISGSVIQIGHRIFYFMLPIVTETHQDRLRRGCVLESQSPVLQLMLLYDALAGSIKLRKSMLLLENGFDEVAFEKAEHLMDTVVASQDRALSQLTLSSIPIQAYRPTREEVPRAEGGAIHSPSFVHGAGGLVNAAYRLPTQPDELRARIEPKLTESRLIKEPRLLKPPREPKPPKESKASKEPKPPRLPKVGEEVRTAKPGDLHEAGRPLRDEKEIAHSIAVAIAAHVNDFDNSSASFNASTTSPTVKRPRPSDFQGGSLGQSHMQAAQAQSIVATLRAQQLSGGFRPSENFDEWAMRRAAIAFHNSSNPNQTSSNALPPTGYDSSRMQYAVGMHGATAGLPYHLSAGQPAHTGLLSVRGGMMVSPSAGPMGAMQVTAPPSAPPGYMNSYRYLGGAPQITGVATHPLSQQDVLRNSVDMISRAALSAPTDLGNTPNSSADSPSIPASAPHQGSSTGPGGA